LAKILRRNNRKHFAGHGNVCRVAQHVIEPDDEAIA
jgi:hypothetical protein